MTIYQEEMQRKAFHYRCTTEFNEETSRLNVSYNGYPLVEVGEKGYLYSESKKIQDDTQQVLLDIKIVDYPIQINICSYRRMLIGNQIDFST